jgi:hypothetical protein
MRYVGWQLGVSYQCPEAEGVSQEYVHGLLQRMHHEGMNLVSFMMVSSGINDPVHDGYAWPVRNPRLRCYLDENVRNARPEQEFLSAEIEYAAGLGMHVQVFTNNFWWDHQKAVVGYPGMVAIHSDDPAAGEWHHVASDKQTWAMACDEARDLLEFYGGPGVRSYGWEMMGVAWSPEEAEVYAETMRRFAEHVHTVRPEVEVWHHGYMRCEGGRSPQAYRRAGVDVVFPCIHLVTSEEEWVAVLESSEEVPLVLHVDVRDHPTRNYDVPLKTPEYIEQMCSWIARHQRDNLLGVMFFNEVSTSPRNRECVYREVGKWRRAGVCE